MYTALLLATLVILYFVQLRVRSKKLEIFAALVVVLTISFRYKIGGDWDSYNRVFNAIKAGGLQAVDIKDPLFLLLNWIAPNLYFTTAFMSLVSFFALHLAFHKIGLRRYILFYLMSFLYIPTILLLGYLRQGVAASFMLLACVMFMSRKWLWGSLSFIFALGFHNPLIRLQVNLQRYLGLNTDSLENQSTSSAIKQVHAQAVSEPIYSSAGVVPRLVFLALLAAILLIFLKIIKDNTSVKKIWTSVLLFLLGLIVVALMWPQYETSIDRIVFYFMPMFFMFFVLKMQQHQEHSLSKNFELILVGSSVILWVIWYLYSPYSHFY